MGSMAGRANDGERRVSAACSGLRCASRAEITPDQLVKSFNSFGDAGALVCSRTQGENNMNKILLIAFGLMATLMPMAAEETQKQPDVGQPAPDFSLTTGDGSQVSLKD